VDEPAELLYREACSHANVMESLKTLVVVNVFGTVGLYEYSTEQKHCDPLPGRMIFENAFNIFCGCVQVPLLFPRCEVIPMPSSRGTCDVWARVMPRGWYRNNLLGAREYGMRFYRDKCLLVVCCLGDQMEDRGRVFGFKEAHPALPVARSDRKGCIFSAALQEGCGGETAALDAPHDDVVNTPTLLLSQAFRWKKELEKHPLCPAVLDM
jgi:hypothetical protein